MNETGDNVNERFVGSLPDYWNDVVTNTTALILDDALKLARDERKTGNLHIFVSLSGSLKDAILVVKSGKLIGCSCLDKVGKDAVGMLLQSVVVKATFIRRNISDYTPQQGMPSIEDVLRELHSIESTPVVRTGEDRNLRRVAEILAPLIGEHGAKLQLMEIAKKYSPDDDAEKFIDACIDLTASYVGEPTARMMFKGLTSHDS